MEFVIVGGHHDGKVINLKEPMVIVLDESYGVDVSVGRSCINDVSFIRHEYTPQSFNFAFCEDKQWVLVPTGQTLPETLSILIKGYKAK